MSNDWFGDFTLDDSWTLDFQSAEADAGGDESGDEDAAFLDAGTSRDIIHKRGQGLDLSRLVQVIHRATDETKGKQINQFLKYLVLYTYGQRNIRKDAISEAKLSLAQKEVYGRIRQELKNPVRKQRIFAFINQKDITKRLINYFVVHYSLVEREISYYLDRRTYPYKVIGEFNNPNQPEVLRLIETGVNIVWINLHQEYKNSKNKKGRRNRHAPYRRSISVQGDDGNEYSLCELNYYLWLDDVGGFEIFYVFEADIRAKKARYDEEKRIQESQPTYGKKKKRKIVLRNTDGRNYKTHILNYKMPASHSVMGGGCSFADYMNQMQQKAQQGARQESDLGPAHRGYQRQKRPWVDVPVEEEDTVHF